MSKRSTPWVWALLVGITLLLGWTRTLGLGAMLPQQREPDPYCVYQAEFLQARAAGEVGGVTEYFGAGKERFFYYYPLHLARLWMLGSPPKPAAVRLEAETLPEHLAAAREPLLRGRLWCAWSSALIVPAVFLLARRFLTLWPALLAAALAGTSLLHLVAAGQAKPHAFAATAIAWGLWGATCLRRHPGPAAMLGAGLLFALGVCSMHYSGVLLGAGAAAFFLRDRHPQGARVLMWALPVVVLCLVYVWSSPGFLIPPPEGSQQSYEGFRIEDGTLIGLGHRIDLSLFTMRHPLRPLTWLWWNDPALLVLAGAGLVVALMAARGLDRERRRDAAVLLAHALPYLVCLAIYNETTDRYMLPLLPHLSVLGAAGVAWFVRALGSRLHRSQAWIAAGSAALALTVPVIGQAALLRLRLRPDTSEMAQRWIQEHVPADQAVGVGPGVALPLIVHPDDLEAVLAGWPDNSWLRYQVDLGEHLASIDGRHLVPLLLADKRVARQLVKPDSGRAWLRYLGVAYIALEDSQRTRALGRAFRDLRAVLKAEGRIVHRAFPRRGPQNPFLDFGNKPEMLRRTLSQERLGPPIEIWKLREEP